MIKCSIFLFQNCISYSKNAKREYRKFPKYSDTQKICYNHSKIWTMWLYHRVMSPNDADGMANSVDPDQTAPLGAVWSGSALFAQAYLSENLGSLPSGTCEPRHDKTNKVIVSPAKTQISLGIRPVWSESSLCAQCVAQDPMFLHADSEDSDQTGPLIWVFAGRTHSLLVLSCRGSCI